MVNAAVDGVSRVRRPRLAAAHLYDRLSAIYDMSEGLFERHFQNVGLCLLGAQRGERILEIGHGTGRCLLGTSRTVGPSGFVAGLDISSGMHRVAERRLRRAGVQDRVELQVGDAISLAYDDGMFDAVFTSFVLELFDTPDIPKVLGECHRVLRKRGRLVVVALTRVATPNLMTRMYEWGHDRLPSLLDCRPIPLRALVEAAGFRTDHAVRGAIVGLPVDAIAASRNGH